MNIKDIEVGKTYYYARIRAGRILDTEVLDLKVLKVNDDSITASNHRGGKPTGRSTLLFKKDIENRLFKHRKDALDLTLLYDEKFEKEKKEIEKRAKMNKVEGVSYGE